MTDDHGQTQRHRATMPDGQTPTILVVGASGYFGSLLVQGLLEETDCRIVVAARRHCRLVGLCRRLGPAGEGRLVVQVVDLAQPVSLESALTGVRIAICAAGPFQELPMTLVQLCLERGIHYIDLSDDRRFVMEVRRLIQAQPRQPVFPVVCPGWSSVPALSAVLTHLAAEGMERIHSIDVQMAPGNRAPRSLATVSSLLASVGRPFTVWRQGMWHSVRGWSAPRTFPFPEPIGPRVGFLVDVPDHELFPSLFGARRVEFRVGAELALWNRLTSVLGWLIRRGAIRQRKRWVALARQAGALLGWLGHDWGALGVEVTGSSAGRPMSGRACVVADRAGHRIPVMPAVLMTNALLTGQTAYRGLVSLDRWLSREQLASACQRWGFRLVVEGPVESHRRSADA